MLKNTGFVDLKGKTAEVFLLLFSVFAETVCNRIKKGGHMRCSLGAAYYNDASPGDSIAFRWDISPRTLSLTAYCRCQVPQLLLLLLLDICWVPAVHLVLINSSNKLLIFNSGLTVFPLVKICLFASSGTIFSRGNYAIYFCFLPPGLLVPVIFFRHTAAQLLTTVSQSFISVISSGSDR